MPLCRTTSAPCGAEADARWVWQSTQVFYLFILETLVDDDKWGCGMYPCYSVLLLAGHAERAEINTFHATTFDLQCVHHCAVTALRYVQYYMCDIVHCHARAALAPAYRSRAGCSRVAETASGCSPAAGCVVIQSNAAGLKIAPIWPATLDACACHGSSSENDAHYRVSFVAAGRLLTCRGRCSTC